MSKYTKAVKKLEELPIEQIDTITSDGDGLCVMLTGGKGDVFCKLITIEEDGSNIKENCNTILKRK
jgi:hypothetical protein